jgi:hypothetical protein
MKRVALPLLLLLVAFITPAQTSSSITYTITQTGCGGTAGMYCRLPVTALPDDGAQSMIIDNRAPSRTGYFDINYPTFFTEFHGAYAGFVGNPDGTKNSFYGIASYEGTATDGSGRKATGSITFFAYYVKTCSGRGCGGEIGWHYQIMSGSNFTVE